MQKVKKIIKYIPAIIIVLIIGFVLLPFIHPIEIYSPVQGIYFEVHGTYAVAVDYDKAIIKIPESFFFRPVTQTHTKGVRSKGRDIVEEIEIPDTVTMIDVCSFNGCDKLTKVTGGKNIRVICDSAFRSDELLTEIPNFEKVEVIEQNAFTDCSLSYLKLPETIKEIGDEAFAYNNISKLDADLNDVTLGIQVFFHNPFQKQMGDFAIYPDGSLQEYNGNDTTIVIPNGVTVISGAFFDFDDDSENIKIYVPSTVTKITTSSLWFSNHGTVYIPDSVTEIDYYDDEEQYSFYNASIVTTKGSNAEVFAKKYNIDYEIVDEIEYPENVE